MTENDIQQQVTDVRRFNRFYTRQIGVLSEGLLDTPWSLTEARVLFELANRPDLTVTGLASQLGVDAGYMSRTVTAFVKDGLVTRSRSDNDGRRRIVTLTDKGQAAYRELNERSGAEVQAMLEGLPGEARQRLLKAMSAIEDVLAERSAAGTPVLIRTHRPGDIGWIIQRHALVYGEEYRWDETFESLVVYILAQLIPTYEHSRDHIWIAELDGERVGCILAAKENEEVVHLRLFLVEPWARGRGIGRLLIREFLQFARQAGYRKATLWTQSCLEAARHLYQRAGFQKVGEESHHSFGHDLMGETWELAL
jgi:DNA-binding MarR family transcriptional regulator/ribosomal protein S18 acetylase RimI-like enzyme